MKNSKWRVWFFSLLGAGFLLLSWQLPGQEFWRVVYSAADGQLHMVSDGGGIDKVLVSNPCHFIDAADGNAGRVVYTLRWHDSLWQIYSITLAGSNAKCIAGTKGRNVFLYYDAATKRVVYALNYNEQEKKGDFYSVSIYGGSSALLALNAVMADIVGDRFVYQREVSTANRNIYSIKLSGSSPANLATTGNDEVYVGKKGTLVIFTRQVNGQTDLYGISNAGSSTRRNGIPLAVDPNLNESFAGATTGRVIYYLEQSQGNDLWSVLPDGTNGKLLKGAATGSASCILTHGERVFYESDFVFSVKHDGIATVQYGKNLAGRYFGFAGVLEGRFIFFYGLEFGYGVYSSSIANPDSDTIVVRAPGYMVYFDVILSATSKRIVMVNKNGIEIISKSVKGQYEAKLGAKLPQDMQAKKKRYLFSTANRHLYAVLKDEANGIWALYSDPLNGGTPVLLFDNLSEENLKTARAFSYIPSL